MAPDTADLSVLFSVSREKHRHNYSEVKHHSELNLRCSLGLRWQTNTQTFIPIILWVLSDYIPRVYHTSISPLSVRTSMMLCPRKSSDSLFRRCFTRDLMSSSSSQTRSLIRSDELWHSLCRQGTGGWAVVLTHVAARSWGEAYASPEQINICLKWFKNHMLYHSAASSSWLINLKEKKGFVLAIFINKKKNRCPNPKLKYSLKKCMWRNFTSCIF